MSTRFDHEIRNAVEGLAHEGRTPVNLAAGAIRAGRRRVLRRRVVSGSATLAVLVALAVPIATGHYPHPRTDIAGSQPRSTASAAQPSPSGTTPTLPVLALDGNLRFDTIPEGADATWILTPTNGYTKVPFTKIVPSPDGTAAAVSDGKRIGVIDLHTGGVRWATTPTPGGGTMDWAPTSDQVAYLTLTRQLAIVRTDGMAGRAITKMPVTCSGLCSPAWLPNGHQIAISSADTAGMPVYETTTGTLKETLPALSGSLEAGHAMSYAEDFAVTHVGKELVVIRMIDGHEMGRIEVSGGVRVYWSSDDSEIVLVGTGMISYYDISGKQMGQADYPNGQTFAADDLPTLTLS